MGERLKVHYLSNNSQNEFIAKCSDLVKHVMEERHSAKYYAIIADSTTDLSHYEQTTFILRYLVRHESRNEIVDDKNVNEMSVADESPLESQFRKQIFM